MTDDQQARLEEAAYAFKMSSDYCGGGSAEQGFKSGAAWMKADMEVRAKAPSEETAPREWKIYGVICAEKGSAAYNAAPSKCIEVIEKSAYAKMEALKDKAAEIAIAIGFEHNQKVREIEQLKADEAKLVAGLVEALKWIAYPTNPLQKFKTAEEARAAYIRKAHEALRVYERGDT